MRTIIALAIGFWLGRHIYIRYDKEEARKKEEALKQKVMSLLEEKGVTPKEAKKVIQKVNSSK